LAKNWGGVSERKRKEVCTEKDKVGRDGKKKWVGFRRATTKRGEEMAGGIEKNLP